MDNKCIGNKWKRGTAEGVKDPLRCLSGGKDRREGKKNCARPIRLCSAREKGIERWDCK